MPDVICFCLELVLICYGCTSLYRFFRFTPQWLKIMCKLNFSSRFAMVSHSVMFRMCIKFQTEFSEIMWRTWPWRRSTSRPRRTWPWRSSTSRPRGCEGGKEQKLEREGGRSSARAGARAEGKQHPR
jgi:hypothetical protein